MITETITDQTKRVWLVLNGRWHITNREGNEYLVEAAMSRHKTWIMGADETREADDTARNAGVRPTWWLVRHSGVMEPVSAVPVYAPFVFEKTEEL